MDFDNPWRTSSSLFPLSSQSTIKLFRFSPAIFRICTTSSSARRIMSLSALAPSCTTMVMLSNLAHRYRVWCGNNRGRGCGACTEEAGVEEDEAGGGEEER